VYWTNDNYYGPAAIVAADRLKILSETDDIARCHTACNCTEACLREVKIIKVIGEVKMAMVTGKL
jgi:succinate dehydrogenase / fumarate reductase iron-sulfur subunit